MTKRRADAMAGISPADPNHPWVSRGYRPQFAQTIRKEPVEDPYGEIAYQRAFLKAAEAGLRRVPDPNLYHNSRSAQEFMKRRDEGIFSVKPRDANTKSSTQPNTPSSAGTPTYSPGQLPSPHYSANSGQPPRRANTKADFEPVLSTSSLSPSKKHGKKMLPKPNGPPAEHYGHIAPNGLPMTLEPRIDAPAGPSRMLR